MAETRLNEPSRVAVILTALPVEFEAVVRFLKDRTERVHPEGTIYDVGSLATAAGAWTIAVAEIGAGNAGAALEAERAAATFKPSVLMFVGVAGGIKDVALGDVVVATKVYGYETGKERLDEFQPRGDVRNSSYSLIQRARREAQKPGWLTRLGERSTGISVLVRPIAAGEKVLAASRGRVASFVKAQYGDAVAVEMEGIGCLTAAQANQGVHAIVVRGISDLLDGKAEADATGSQRVAAARASAFACEMLAQFYPGVGVLTADTARESNAAARSDERALPTLRNVLGDARAEADQMLDRAFVRTSDYQALTEGTDYNFVVGRRGTGKSALFRQLPQRLYEQRKIVLDLKPLEFETTELRSLLSRRPFTYRAIRNVTRLLWQLQILTSCVDALRDGSYKTKKFVANYDQLVEYQARFKTLFATAGVSRALDVLKSFEQPILEDLIELPGAISKKFELNALMTATRQALVELGTNVVLLYDGLDEGWEPDAVSTAILGGLAKAAADLAESKSRIHCLLFVRDNMFRALAYLDDDYSRHIEGATLRLFWTEESLLRFVAERLRVSFGWDDAKDARIWNRFAQRELHERAGFQRCLKYTLYRPRDVLVLLNTAFSIATRDGRDRIVESDVERSARMVSGGRLEDLLKEYQGVLPGVRTLVDAFRGGRAKQTVETLVALLDSTMEKVKAGEHGSSYFAVLGRGDEAAAALYAIGFVGVWSDKTAHYVFCHDGSDADFRAFSGDTAIIVHPCYWKGLDLSAEGIDEEVLIDVHDDYEKAPGRERAERSLKDQRTRLLGQVHGDLQTIPAGPAGREQFETWARSAIQILLAGKISGVRFNPNKVDSQIRDIATKNIATSGFWSRVRGEFGISAVLWRVANTDASRKDEINRAMFYDTREWGRFQVLITRASEEALSADERKALREVFHAAGILVLVIPAEMIARCLRKARNADRADYVELMFEKRLRVFKKSYLRNG